MAAAPDFRELILDSTRRVVERARHVRLDDAALDRLALALLPESRWLAGAPPRSDEDSALFDGDDEHAQWLFVVNSINFSFWDEDEAGRWRWPAGPGAVRRKGALGVGDSLRAAQARGAPITDAEFLSRLGTEEFAEILGGTGRLPMMEERRRALNEVGRVLADRYGGQVARLVRAAAGSTDRLLALVVADFPSFRDVARLGGEDVYLLKRAQIFAADLFSVFGGGSLGQFDRPQSLTACADYKLPQLLRSAGALAYAPGLSARVDAGLLIPAGSREEVEIRAATVLAVEGLRARLEREAGAGVYACLLDNCLWHLSRRPEYASGPPHHRTRTIHY